MTEGPPSPSSSPARGKYGAARMPGPRFLGQVAIFASLLLSLHMAAAVIQLGAPTETTSRAASYDATQRAIASRLPSPKIVYVSGSSGFYSVRTDALVSAQGKECVNLGLHAGLGAKYLLDRAIALLAKGDICVLGLEYELYGENRPGEFLCDYLMARDVPHFYSLGLLGSAEVVLAAGPARIWNGVLAAISPRKNIDNSQWLTNLSSRGDRLNTTPADRGSDGKLATCLPFDAQVFSGVSPRAATAIDHFLAICRDKGVTVFAAYPPLCVTGSAPNRETAKLQERFENFWHARDVVVIGSAGESLYAPQDAFDTPYHLMDTAAYLHSCRLSASLSEALSRRRSGASESLPHAPATR